MNLQDVKSLAHAGRLYPSLILHGGEAQARLSAAIDLARTLLCDAEVSDRPCGVCRHCRRIVAPGVSTTAFHPDFHLLERDLKTATSVEATRAMLLHAQVSPFEARGQVFVIASAESLGGGAANALLKSLEEPHITAPRHFLLLAPSQYDLLPTLRSRSLAVFLGSTPRPAGEGVRSLAESFGSAVAACRAPAGRISLLSAAAVLEGAGGWDDPRAAEPWALASAAVLESVDEIAATPQDRRALLSLAQDLLGGPTMRLRGISPKRILEGLVVRRLGCGSFALRQGGG